ncbi:MAG: hypothetical protein ACXVB9_05360 [Bdellovibrionota bacterium]
MKRALELAAVILVIWIVIAWWIRPDVSPVLKPTVGGPPPGVLAAPKAPPTDPGKLPAPAPSAESASAAFTAFLATDAKLLDSTHVDSAAAEEREKAQAASMGPAEIAYARELALNDKANGNQRVLAVDLLARVGFPRAAPALEDLITKGMNSARAQPHTVDEISNTQAKAFAIMAVDSIAAHAVKDPAARDELVRLGGQAKDSTIQKYIQGKIRSLPPL